MVAWLKQLSASEQVALLFVVLFGFLLLLTVGLFLNSLPGQMQTERSWTGSSGQIELRSELIENYTVWKPDTTFQQRVRELVEGAHVARKEAWRLLEEAKQRVEEMVLE